LRQFFEEFCETKLHDPLKAASLERGGDFPLLIEEVLTYSTSSTLRLVIVFGFAVEKIGLAVEVAARLDEYTDYEGMRVLWIY
jgi:hypothetical protein